MTEHQGQTTSQKHNNFANKSMIGQCVTALPGIADVYGATLKRKGYDTAYLVYSKFLELKENEEDFKEWLKKTAEGDLGNAQKTYNALNEWHNRFG